MDVELGCGWRRRWRRRPGRRIGWYGRVHQDVAAIILAVIFVGAGWQGWRIGWQRRIAFAGFVDLHRVAVELGVGEMGRGATKVHHGEVELLGVFMDPGAATQNLLELGHRAHGPIQHDQAAGLCVHPGRQQPGGGRQHRVR